MTAKEMHLEINQSLQQVSANRTRKFLQEEIDWVLNKTQTRYIQSCLRPVQAGRAGKFRFADQLRADALRNLLVYKNLPCYYEREGTVKASLPKDYSYLMSDTSLFYLLCKGETATRVQVNENYHCLKLLRTGAPTAPYYTSGLLTVGGVQVNIPSSLGLYHNYQGFQSKDDVMFLKDWLLAKLWQEGVEVYWEKYGSAYEPDSFIFPGSLPVPLTLSWDGIGVTQVTSRTVTLEKDTISDKTVQRVDNRLLSPHDVQTLYTPYHAPSAQSPASELIDAAILVHHAENTIVDSVFVSYLRKPQPISLSLGSNCELAEQFHQTICDLSTEYILGQLKDQNGQQLKTQDNETRVIL